MKLVEKRFFEAIVDVIMSRFPGTRLINMTLTLTQSCLDEVQQLNSLLHSVNIIGRRELVEVDAGEFTSRVDNVCRENNH